jgi:hypothetical protein
MIALDPSVGYIHEPFNPLTPPGISAAPVVDGLTYVSAHNREQFYPAISRTLSFSYDLPAGLGTIRSARDAARLARDYWVTTRNRWRGLQPLMKDPLAVLSVEWLAAEFDMDVVIMVRHPYAFAGSLKRLGWEYDFGNLLSQRELMRDHFHGFAEEIQSYGTVRHDIIQQAALLWKIIHHRIAEYRRRHPEWAIVRHEDLAREPADGFRALYDHLGLDYTPAIEAEVKRASSPTNATMPSSDPVHGVHRNSRAQIDTWRTRLTEVEARQIDVIVGQLSQEFYPESG